MKPADLQIPERTDVDREHRGPRPQKLRIPDCPALDALVVDPSQLAFVRDGFGTAHRVRGVKLFVPGSRRPFLLSVTRRRRFSAISWSLVVEAPIRGIPRFYADTGFAASDALATAVAIELFHRFSGVYAAMSSTRGAVRLAVHGEPYTRDLAANATAHLVAIVALLRLRLEVPRPRPRLTRREHDDLRALVERTEILERERESAFLRFRDTFAAWRALDHTSSSVWWTGPVDDEVRARVERGAVVVARDGGVWPELVVRSRGAPPDVVATRDGDPRASTLVRVLRARLQSAEQWLATVPSALKRKSSPDPARGRRAEFSFVRGAAKLVVVPADPLELDALSAREGALRFAFHVLESDVMRFNDATRNVPRTRSTPLGYERLLGPLADYAPRDAAALVEAPLYRGLTSTRLPEGWK